MAGKIKKMIDTIIEQGSHGNKILVGVVKMKLIMNGIDPKLYALTSPDDPAVVGKLVDMMYALE